MSLARCEVYRSWSGAAFERLGQPFCDWLGDCTQKPRCNFETQVRRPFCESVSNDFSVKVSFQMSRLLGTLSHH